MEISGAEILKIFGGVVVGVALSRFFKATDSCHDLAIRVAILTERLDNLVKTIGVLERNEKTQFALIDKVRKSNVKTYDT